MAQTPTETQSPLNALQGVEPGVPAPDRPDDLAHFIARKAVFLASSPTLSVLALDALAVETSVLVVINLSMLGRRLGRVCVVRRYSGQ